MKQILLATTLALTVIVSSPFAHGQTAVEAWVQRYHEADAIENMPRAIAVDSNGNAIATGYSTDTNGFKHWVTIAYSSSGTALWSNRYHGPLDFVDDQPNSVAVDAEANAFVAGVSFGMAGDQDYVVIKYSPAGVPLWTNHYIAGFTDNARAVVVDSSGNVIVTGQSYRDFQTSDIVTVAYSNAGVPLWTNRYNGPANGDDFPLTKDSLALGSNGSAYVTAASDGDFSNSNVPDFVTIKYVVPASSPSLGITRSNSFVVLSWPAAFGNFQLQSNTNISLSNGWSPIMPARTTNNGSISVTPPATGSRNFFRLWSP